MMRALVVLLLALVACAPSWATTYHVCTAATGDGSGSSADNCRAGYVGGFAPGAGDRVILYAGGYYDKLIITNSGSAGAPSVWEFRPGAFIFESLDLSADKSISTTSTSTVASGSTWVDAGNGIVRKGVNYFYYFYVDGVMKTPGPRVYTNEADVLANLPPGYWTIISRTTGSFNRALYYNGATTSDMRGNRIQASSTAADGYGAIILKDVHDVTLTGPEVRSYYANFVEIGGIYVDNSYNIIVNDCSVHDSSAGVRLLGGYNLTVDGCDLYGNFGQGLAIAGNYNFAPSGVTNQISLIDKTNPAVVHTVEAHGLSNGEKVALVSVGGMTQVSYGAVNTEFTTANVTANTFELSGVNATGYTATTGTGRLFIQRGIHDVFILNNNIHDNGNYPRWNGINFAWGGDADGAGIGYLGGAVDNVIFLNNKFERNGPARDVDLSIETGDIKRGSGIYTGTSYTMPVTNFKAINNFFSRNTRLHLSYGDATSGVIIGNIFARLRNYAAVADQKYAVQVGGEHVGTGTYSILNNTFYGESGLGPLWIDTSRANSTFDVRNNAFVSTRPSAGNESTFTTFRYSSAVSAALLTEANNKFIDSYGGFLYKAVNTAYNTVAEWQAATSKGANDEVLASAGLVSSTPTAAADFKLRSDSALKCAGSRTVPRFTDMLGYGSEPDCASIGALNYSPAGQARTTALSPRTTALEAAP